MRFAGGMPEAFPVVGQSHGVSVRRRVHGNYLILYRLRPDTVFIQRVVHGARDHAKLLRLSRHED
jgi:plasmid stabilization system protein ParE